MHAVETNYVDFGRNTDEIFDDFWQLIGKERKKSGREIYIRQFLLPISKSIKNGEQESKLEKQHKYSIKILNEIVL